MALAVTKTELRKLLSQAPFTHIYGFRLHSMADGECTLDVPFWAAFERPGGLVSGPVFMAAADVAMWGHRDQARHRGHVRDGQDDNGLSECGQERGFSVYGQDPEAGYTADLWDR